MRSSSPSWVAILALFAWPQVLAGCAGSGSTAAQSTTATQSTTGGEQGAGASAAPDGGAQAEGSALPDPSAASLDEPPPPAVVPPANLAGREGVPPEGILREEPRAEGGVRLVAALPVSPDGNAVFEIQTTPGRSGGLAVFTVRAVHEAALWASCSSLALDLGGRSNELDDVRVLAAASTDGVLETARALADFREARRLSRSRIWRVDACGESFEPAPAARPILSRLVARFDELSRAPAPAPAKRR